MIIHTTKLCPPDCPSRILASYLPQTITSAISVYADSGLISIELIKELEKLLIERQSPDGLTEINRLRRHIIRVDTSAALGQPRKGVFGELCATPSCNRPARWLAIDEVHELGSKAPYRCTECVDARKNNQSVLF